MTVEELIAKLRDHEGRGLTVTYPSDYGDTAVHRVNLEYDALDSEEYVVIS